MSDDVKAGESFEKRLSELQSTRAKKPRNRTSLARTAVRFVLREAAMYPGIRSSVDLETQNNWEGCYAGFEIKRGRSLARYRHFVGCECRLQGRGIDIEVTVIEDEYGRPDAHEFFCNTTFRKERIVDATLRKIVKQISRELGQDN